MNNKNDKVIDELISHKKETLKNQKPKDLTGFKLGDLKVEVIDDKNRKISLNGIKVQGRALVALSNKLKIKPAFFDFSQKIGEKEFSEISDRLKHIEEETPIFAIVDKHDTKQENFISEMYFTRPGMKQIDNSKYFDMLINALKETEIEYHLSSFSHQDDTSFVQLTNPTRDLLVLPDDPWKTGSSIYFNPTEFNINPYFLRTICTNGCTTHQQGFRAQISNKKYNEVKIQEMISLKLNTQFELLNSQIKNRVDLFSKNNASIAEFMWVRSKMYKDVDDKDVAVDMVNKFFPDAHLFEAYKCKYDEKPDQWLQTADAGINAYDLFNKMTYFASHPKESRVNRAEAGDIMIDASNFLFKENLDLTQIAPKVTFISKN